MIKSQFSYCPLTLKFSSQQSNTLINKIHERSLRLIANDDNNNFETLFQNNRDITVHHSKFRSSCPEVYLRKGVLKIYSKFTGEHPSRSAISIKLQSILFALWHGCSPVNLLHIFRIPFPRNTSGWLLLSMENSND